jgi:biopolymer transport protein TolQ
MPEVTATADLMSPLNLFLQADAVVKAVMLGLLLASIWTWAIIFTHSIRLRRINRGTDSFEREFWATNDIDAFHDKRASERLPIAAVMSAAMDEWRRSTKTAQVDRAGTRERLASRMNAAVAAELDRLSDRLNILATVGSVAPFVGLFGTVWGIMRSFTAIAGANNTSLAVVAPGIAEALFATAIGLFAAIPAVIAYNRLTHGLDRHEAKLSRFADRFHATLSRELEVEVATGH